MRLNDVRDRTEKVKGVLERYERALEEKGMVGGKGGGDLYASFFALKQGKSVPARQGAHTAW
jgi:hypothetical protein